MFNCCHSFLLWCNFWCGCNCSEKLIVIDKVMRCVSVCVYLDCCLRHGVPGGSPWGSEPGPPGARRWPWSHYYLLLKKKGPTLHIWAVIMDTSHRAFSGAENLVNNEGAGVWGRRDRLWLKALRMKEKVMVEAVYWLRVRAQCVSTLGHCTPAHGR